jgi:hypothetical protein
MGLRLRLKSTFDISSFSRQDQVILTALMQYGMILADNGSAIFISGAPDNRWNNSDLSNLKKITASSFEVVSMNTVYISANVPAGTAPMIGSFTATPTSVPAGYPVSLSWATSNAIYDIISPNVGPVRGNTVTVNPKSAITYTLYSTNQYGRTTASVSVAVH